MEAKTLLAKACTKAKVNNIEEQIDDDLDQAEPQNDSDSELNMIDAPPGVNHQATGPYPPILPQKKPANFRHGNFAGRPSYPQNKNHANPPPAEKKTSVVCFRCGIDGHISTECQTEVQNFLGRVVAFRSICDKQFDGLQQLAVQNTDNPAKLREIREEMHALVMQIEDLDTQIHEREQAAKEPLEPKN